MKNRILFKVLSFVLISTIIFSSAAFAAFNPESKRISNKLTASFKIGKVITEDVSMTWGDNTTAAKSFDVEAGAVQDLSVRAMPKKALNNVGIVLQISGDTETDVAITKNDAGHTADPDLIKIGTNAYMLAQYATLSSLQQKDFSIKFNKEGDYTLNIYAVQLSADEKIVRTNEELSSALSDPTDKIRNIWAADFIGNYNGGFDITRSNVTLSALNKGGVTLANSITITGNDVTIDGFNVPVDNTLVSGIYISGDNVKIKNCIITGKGNTSAIDKNGISTVPSKKISLTVENTEFKNIYRGICLNGSSTVDGPTLTATNNKFNNIGYGIGNTEGCKLSYITGNQFITGIEAFGLGKNVSSTLSGIDNATEIKDYLLANNTFTGVTNHVGDYTDPSKPLIYTKTN